MKLAKLLLSTLALCGFASSTLAADQVQVATIQPNKYSDHEVMFVRECAHLDGKLTATPGHAVRCETADGMAVEMAFGTQGKIATLSIWGAPRFLREPLLFGLVPDACQALGTMPDEDIQDDFYIASCQSDRGSFAAYQDTNIFLMSAEEVTK